MRLPEILFVSMALAALACGQISNIVVTSATTYERGLPAPGSVATAFCTGLKGIPGVVSADRLPLPLELAGVRVLIGGVRAPLFSVAELGGYQQVNFQVPWEYDIFLGITISQGTESVNVVMPRSLSPGEFFRLPDGKGLFLHGDYSLVTPESPAHTGEVVIGYFTGLSVRPMPSIPTGSPNPVGQPSWEGMLVPRTQHRLWELHIADSAISRTVDPEYLGPAPGLVGVLQVNFRIPAGFGTSRRPEIRLAQYECATMFGMCVAAIPRQYSRFVSIAIQ